MRIEIQQEKHVIKHLLLLLPCILILLSACNEVNVYQKLNITKKPELELVTPAILEIKSDESIVDLAEIFSPSSTIHLNVTVGDDFTGKVLRGQDKHSLNKMVEKLLSKAYTKSELPSFLNSEITNEDIALALKGNAQLMYGTKAELVNIFSSIPTIAEDDDAISAYLTELGLSATDENKAKALKLIQSYNAYITDLKDASISFLNSLFDPLLDYLTAESYKWCDYVRIQLTTNIVDGIINALSESIDEISFDLSDQKSIDEFFNYIKAKSTESIYSLALNTVKHIISPLAGMDQLASRYKELLLLPDLTDLIKIAKGDSK